MRTFLHAIWLPPSLHLWGEAVQAEEVLTLRVLPPHELRAWLGEQLSDGLLATVGREQPLALRLPHDGAIPLRSTQSGPVVVEEPLLETVHLSSLAFTAADAVDLLLGLTSGSVEVTDSVDYWARLTRMVVRRLAARRFYPHLERHPQGGLVAGWRVVVHSQPELDWLERYADAMPPACRALEGLDPSSLEPRGLVESFLALAADAVVRQDLGHDPFFTRLQERAEAVDAPPESRWLAALVTQEPGVRPGDSAEDQRLLERATTWVAPLETSGTDAPLRLGFALEEPDNPDDPDPHWLVRFFLEPEDESGEVFDAESLFEGNGQTQLLGRTAQHRRDVLLAELARAAEAVPTLRPALEDPRPVAARLSTPEAHLFIRQWSADLVARGFAVRLPEWATQRRAEPGLELVLNPQQWPQQMPDSTGGRGESFSTRGSSFGLDSLLEFDWQVAIGDLRMSGEQFRDLASRRSPLVRVQDRWVQLDVEQAERAVQYLQRRQPEQLTLAAALRTAFGAGGKEDPGLPVVRIRGTGWLEQFLEQNPVKLQALGQPEAFNGQLRQYQLRGLQWMAFLARIGIGGCLADDMGLGKTIQLIALLQHERQDASAGENGIGPTLLFAPTSVVGNWVRELQRFAPALRVLVHHGPERLSGDAFARAAAAHDVVLTSYALAHRDREHLARPRWYRIALDEAQKIKNPSAASSQAIRSLQAPQRIALTGTPIENHLTELWSIIDMLNPGLLGSAAEFRDRFAIPIEKLGDRERAERLRRLVRPFILRRTKADPEVAGDLPDKLEMKVYCNLTPEQAATYQEITGRMLTQIDRAQGIQRRGLILAALTRLKQVCDHPALLSANGQELDDRSGKCERLVEMLEEVLEEGDAALVFTQFRQMGHLLERLLVQRLRIPVLFLHGGTPAQARDQMIQRFQAREDGARVFLLSLRAGGLGLNLTAANHVFHFDRWWNPAVEAQATDRAHRIGQTRTVQVHKFVCMGTVEERIDRLLTEKTALADRIVGSGDEWLTNLSTDQLREYLALSKEAVAEF